MLLSSYLSGQLPNILESLQTVKSSSVLQIKAKLEDPTKTRTRILILKEGNLIYGGTGFIDNKTLARRMGILFKPNSIEIALKVLSEKLGKPDSVRELLELLVSTRVLNWEQIHKYIYSQLGWTIEQLLPYAGEIKVAQSRGFDLEFPASVETLSLKQILFNVQRREEGWRELSPIVPSMEAVPVLAGGALEKINDPVVVQHLQKWVNGERSIVEISEGILAQDPLKLSHRYYKWAQWGWLNFHDDDGTPSGELEDDKRDTVLAVDDSPIVQTMIRRALGDRYNVLIASSAKEALNLLNRKSIDLLLLDVTMPDIDGLEMCRTVRLIPKFKNLPIVMLTARDGYVDKFKGYAAGTTKYLTKPFKNEDLIAVIGECLGSETIPSKSELIKDIT